MPILWLTWLRDPHFPLDAQQATYRAAAGPRMVAVLPDMGHSHQAGLEAARQLRVRHGDRRDRQALGAPGDAGSSTKAPSAWSSSARGPSRVPC